MKIIEIQPGMAPQFNECENTLAGLQELVDGPIEAVTLYNTGLVALVNEEGRLRRMEPNGAFNISPWQDAILCGPVLVVRASVDDFVSVHDGDLEMVQQMWRAVTK